jgi:hypothetical protein
VPDPRVIIPSSSYAPVDAVQALLDALAAAVGPNSDWRHRTGRQASNVAAAVTRLKTELRRMLAAALPGPGNGPPAAPAP